MALLATGRLVQKVGIGLVMVIVLETAPDEENQAWLLLVSGPHLYAQVETPGRANLAWIVVRTCARTRLETPGTATLRYQRSEVELPVQAVKAICSITKSSRSATWRCFMGAELWLRSGAKPRPSQLQFLLLLDPQIWQKDVSTMNAPLVAGPLRTEAVSLF